MKFISAAFGQASLALSKITATILGTVAAGLFSLGMSQPASATVIDSDNDTFQVNFSVVIDDSSPGSSVPAGQTLTLDATITYFVVDFDATNDEVELEITIKNDAFASFTITGNRVDITSMGFATEPDTDTVTMDSAGTVFDFADLDSLPSLSAIEVCASSSPPNNCQGGGSTGVGVGDMDMFTLLLEFDFDISGGVDISDTGLKWQTDFGSFEITGGNGNGGFLIPEPATLLLFGIGLLGLGVFARRRRFAA